MTNSPVFYRPIISDRCPHAILNTKLSYERLQDQQHEQRAVDRGERERDEAHQVALRREADEDDLR